MPTTDPTVSEQLNSVPAATRPILRAARRAIKAAAPKGTEASCQMRQPASKSMLWKIARYQNAKGENVVGIGTFTSYAALFFYRGSELDDGRGILDGSGKALRFVRLRTPSDAERPALKRLLRQAFSL